MAEKTMGYALLLPKFTYRWISKPARAQDELLKEHVIPVIKKRRQLSAEEAKGHLDLIQSLIEAGLQDEEILVSLKTIIWAGVMNTASTTHHTILDIFSRPHIAEKVIEEQKNLPFNYSSLEKMEYLENCIKETLRTASAPFGAVRSTNEDFKLNDSKYFNCLSL